MRAPDPPAANLLGEIGGLSLSLDRAPFVQSFLRPAFDRARTKNIFLVFLVCTPTTRALAGPGSRPSTAHSTARLPSTAARGRLGRELHGLVRHPRGRLHGNLNASAADPLHDPPRMPRRRLTSWSSSSSSSVSPPSTATSPSPSSPSAPSHRPCSLDVPLANGPHHPTNNSWLGQSSAIAPLRLTHRPREESTRIQLQRQRLRQRHVTAIVSRSIPGLKTSAAFFASLRTNLRLHACPPPSPLGTPPSMRASTSSLPPPSPLSAPADAAMENNSEVAASESDPLAGVPELKTYLTHDQEEKVAAIKLTADSVAQMRQTANQSLILHRVNTPAALALMAVLAQVMRERHYDWTIILTTMAGLLMALLATTRWFTKDYLFAAEDINWAWRDDADVIVTKFGDEVIGTVIIDWLSGESRQKRKKAWRGEIKSWTVRLRYRNKGVGAALLEEAIKESQRKGAETVEFAEHHANSKRILPKIYNAPFDQRDKKSRALLQDLLDSSSRGGAKRK